MKKGAVSPYPIHIERKKCYLSYLFICSISQNFSHSLAHSVILLSVYWAHTERGDAVMGSQPRGGYRQENKQFTMGVTSVLMKSAGLRRLPGDLQPHLGRSSKAFWRKSWFSLDLRLGRTGNECQAEGRACKMEWRGEHGAFEEQIPNRWKEGWGELRVKPRWDLERLCKPCEGIQLESGFEQK